MNVDAWSADRAASAAESGDLALPASARPVIFGLNSVVSSGHWLTTMAGARMLLAGGNAFDAAAAATFAAAVVEPTSSFSLGSECVFMLYVEESERTLSLCGQGVASLKADPAYFTSRGYETIATGPGEAAPLAFTTPGMVAATLRLLEDHGTMALPDILAPAISYACDGIVSYDYMVSRLSDTGRDQFNLFASQAAEIFYPRGKPAPVGSIIVQRALGAVLRELSEVATGTDRLAGIRAARDAFYQGSIARRIASASEAVGGILSLDDLNAYSEEYEKPARTTFHGYLIECQSFWSQAPTVLQALNMLELFDLKSLGFNTPEYIHLVTEAMKLAFADREAYYGDPKFSQIRGDVLLSKAYAKERAQAIDPSRACPRMPSAGRIDDRRAGPPPEPAIIESTEPEYGTTHISVADRFGNLVASTPSGGAFGKSVFLDDLGFTLSTRSEMLNLEAGHPNCVAPGKRPRTTLVNYMAKGPQGDMFTFGCPGGDAQAQGNLQIILNTIIWGMDPQQAVEAPRFATMSVPNSFYPHSYFPGRLTLEHPFSPETEEALAGLGHEVVRAATCGMGAVVTRLDPRSGVRATSSDPRRSCHAMGW